MMRRFTSLLALGLFAATAAVSSTARAADVQPEPPFLVIYDQAASAQRPQIEADVVALVEQRLGELRRCYNDRLHSKPTLQGKAFLQFGIAPSGALDALSSDGSPINDSTVEQCVLNVARRWTLPKAKTPSGTYPKAFVICPLVFKLDASPPPPAPATPSAPTPAAAADEAATTDRQSIDKELIRVAIRKHIDEVKSCYERELATRPTAEGRVMIEFTIGKKGRVTASAVKSSTLGSAQAEQCIADAVKGWEFPKPRGGKVVVDYPFVLRTAAEKPQRAAEEKPPQVDSEEGRLGEKLRQLNVRAPKNP